MPLTKEAAALLRARMDELADAGRCVNCREVETELQAEGYSAGDVQDATSDADARRAFNERCVRARIRTLRQREEHPRSSRSGRT